MRLQSQYVVMKSYYSQEYLRYFGAFGSTVDSDYLKVDFCVADSSSLDFSGFYHINSGTSFHNEKKTTEELQIK